MNIAEVLKIKAAAKAYLGALAVAAQVALDYMPDHNTGWYTATQVVLGALGVIGIFAIPNKVAEAKDVVDQAKKFASTIVVNTAANADPKKIASELTWQLGQLAGGAPAASVTPTEPTPVTDTSAPVTDPAPAAPAPATDPAATPIQKDTPAP